MKKIKLVLGVLALVCAGSVSAEVVTENNIQQALTTMNNALQTKNVEQATQYYFSGTQYFSDSDHTSAVQVVIKSYADLVNGVQQAFNLPGVEFSQQVNSQTINIDSDAQTGTVNLATANSIIQNGEAQQTNMQTTLVFAEVNGELKITEVHENIILD